MPLEHEGDQYRWEDRDNPAGKDRPVLAAPDLLGESSDDDRNRL
jgi:hypothetical protein